MAPCDRENTYDVRKEMGGTTDGGSTIVDKDIDLRGREKGKPRSVREGPDHGLAFSGRHPHRG